MDLSVSQLVIINIWFIIFYISVYIWAINYTKLPKRYNELKDKEYSKQDYYNQFIEWVSITHAWVSIIIGTYWVYFYGTRPNDRTVDSEYILMMSTLAYLSFDLILELYLNIWDSDNFLHHVFGIFPMILVLYYDYGGSSIVAITYYSELSNPCYLRRNLYKRIGMENSIEHQISLWLYAAVFIYWRAYIFYFICKEAMEVPIIPIILKLFCCLFLFISQGWIVYLFGMLWKSLPNWFSNPDKIKNTKWWSSVRQTYTKITRENPGYTICLSMVVFVSFLTPFSYGVYHSFKS